MLTSIDFREFNSQLKHAKTKVEFDSLVIDLLTRDWDDVKIRDVTVKEMEKLLLNITKHSYFNRNTFETIIKHIDYNKFTVHNQCSTDFVITLLQLEEYLLPEDIREIYNKFNRSAIISSNIARNSITPKDVLQKLIFHEAYSVVAAIADNTGRDALELLKEPEMAQRVLFAQLLLKEFANHLL